MKKLKVLIVCLILVLTVSTADAKEIKVYMVHSETCGYCKDANAFFDAYVKGHKNIVVHKYGVYDEKNEEILEKIEDTLNKNISSIPLIIIGERYLTGFNESKKNEIIKTIEYYEKNDYYDPVGEVLGLKSKDALDKSKEEPKDEQENLEVEDPLKEIIVEDEKTNFFKSNIYEIIIGLLIVTLIILEIIKRKPSN